MNQKITKTEFEKWSQQLEQIYREFAKNSTFQDQVAKDEFISLGSIAIFYTNEGVIQAVLLGMVHLEIVNIKDDVPLLALGGLTFRQAEEKILNRIKEHCVANGYYNPSSPPDLALLKKRKKKIGTILLRDKEQLNQLLVYADSEEYEVITKTVRFLENLEKLNLDKSENNDVDIPRELDFFTEDLVKRVEKLISKKEQAEKTNKPSSPTSSPPVSKPPHPTHKNDLEIEIKQLQDQIKELESKVDKATNSTEKKTYQDILNNTKDHLKVREKEKENLDKGQGKNSESPKSDGKINLAIGLGIAAVVIGIICLILLAGRRRKR